MTTDDDRIAFLEGDDAANVDASERAALDSRRSLLAAAPLWEQPSSGLEDSIVAAVRAEAAKGDDASAPNPNPPASATEQAPVAEPDHVAPVVPLQRHRRLWRVLGGAAVAAAAVIVALLLVPNRAGDTDRLEAALTSEQSPELTGTAVFTRTDSGWRIELDAPALPRLADGPHYQAWLRNDDGVLVPIGTFNEGDDVVLWAGVSPREFNTITITRESADGDQASSGDRVLAGPIVE